MSNNIYDEICEEEHMQNLQWGEQNHPPGYWMLILAEELGEASHEFLHENLHSARHELIQATAVLVQWIRCIDRVKENPTQQEVG